MYVVHKISLGLAIGAVLLLVAAGCKRKPGPFALSYAGPEIGRTFQFDEKELLNDPGRVWAATETANGLCKKLWSLPNAYNKKQTIEQNRQLQKLSAGLIQPDFWEKYKAVNLRRDPYALSLLGCALFAQTTDYGLEKDFQTLAAQAQAAGHKGPFRCAAVGLSQIYVMLSVLECDEIYFIDVNYRVLELHRKFLESLGAFKKAAENTSRKTPRSVLQSVAGSGDRKKKSVLLAAFGADTHKFWTKQKEPYVVKPVPYKKSTQDLFYSKKPPVYTEPVALSAKRMCGTAVKACKKGMAALAAAVFDGQLQKVRFVWAPLNEWEIQAADKPTVVYAGNAPDPKFMTKERFKQFRKRLAMAHEKEPGYVIYHQATFRRFSIYRFDKSGLNTVCADKFYTRKKTYFNLVYCTKMTKHPKRFYTAFDKVSPTKKPVPCRGLAKKSAGQFVGK